MTAESALLVAFGVVSGFALGWVTAWRHARKLEHHGVALWKWDRHWDAQAAPAENVRKFERRESER